MSDLLTPKEILDDFARDLKCVFEPDSHKKYVEARDKLNKNRLLGREEIQHLFCQHCRAIQKVLGVVADCWYNPLDREAPAFCASNEDFTDQILPLLPVVYTDEELVKKIAEIINCEADNCSDYCEGSDGCQGCQANQIHTLYLGRMEKAYKRGMEDAQIEKAMEEEDMLSRIRETREQIYKWVEEHSTFEGRGAGTMTMKVMKWWWQALKATKEEK